MKIKETNLEREETMETQAINFPMTDIPIPTLAKKAEYRLQNCWEFKQCGREPGGKRAAELGVCLAATFKPADGFCAGQNGGRGCAYIVGAFCSGTVPGTRKDLSKHCTVCGFYQRLKSEHGGDMFYSRTFTAYVRHNEGAVGVLR
jgi:hypothetical protein